MTTRRMAAAKRVTTCNDRDISRPIVAPPAMELAAIFRIPRFHSWFGSLSASHSEQTVVYFGAQKTENIHAGRSTIFVSGFYGHQSNLPI